MLKHQIFALLGLSAILIFSNCNNDDPPSFTEADLTIENGWSIIAIASNLDDLAPVIAASIPEEELGFFTREMIEALFVDAANELETVEVCEGDDVYTFLETGTISYNNNGTVCPNGGGNPTADAALEPNSRWVLTGNLLTITDASQESFNFTIKELNANRLVIEAREPFEDDTTGFSIPDELIVTYTMTAN